LAVDLGDLLAQVQLDVVFFVPGERVQNDLVQCLFAGQHRAEQNAVVVRVRFGAEHGDVVQVGGDLQQFFERADAGHAVADHHELHLLHQAVSGRGRASLRVRERKRGASAQGPRCYVAVQQCTVCGQISCLVHRIRNITAPKR